jgi:hypothetical protein
MRALDQLEIKLWPTMLHERRGALAPSDRFCARAMRAYMWPVTARLECLQSAGRVAFQMLVRGLAANPKLLAQIGDREPIGLRQ